MNMLELIALKLQHTPKIKALVTIYDKRTNFSQRMLEDMKKVFRDSLFKTVIRINVTLKEAASAGIPIDRFNRHSKGAEDYIALADEVAREAKRVALENFYKGAEAIINRAKTGYRFMLESKTAKEVYVVGDFNNWTAGESSRMASKGDGIWETAVPLKAGSYRYKFVVDGQWTQDPRNSQTESNPFGGVDSVLVVKN
jgi:hypothetical protein